jgi:tRNA (guanine-N7-)-methyltransferase
MLHGDARRLFHILLPDACAAAVHVYFPDPWWKKRHLKRRLMNDLFLQQIERVLAPGGVLHFWTDVEEYFRATCELIPSITHLAGPKIPAPLPAAHDLDYRTHFERRMRQHDEAVFRSEFHKPAPAI